MNDDLKAKLTAIIDKAVRPYDDGRPYADERRNYFIGAMVDQIHQAYQEERHEDALIWYTRLTNDLINDDDLKRTDHVGCILEYARLAAGLTEEDVKIELPDKYIPHDPDFVVEHISPVLKVDNKSREFEVDPSKFRKPKEHLND